MSKNVTVKRCAKCRLSRILKSWPFVFTVWGLSVQICILVQRQFHVFNSTAYALGLILNLLIMIPALLLALFLTLRGCRCIERAIREDEDPYTKHHDEKLTPD